MSFYRNIEQSFVHSSIRKFQCRAFYQENIEIQRFMYKKLTIKVLNKMLKLLFSANVKVSLQAINGFDTVLL